VRKLRRLLLAVRGWTAEAESMEDDAADSGHLTRVRRVQQRLEAPRIQLRRFHRHLRAHAGGRHGERSPRRLFPISRGERNCRVKTRNSRRVLIEFRARWHDQSW